LKENEILKFEFNYDIVEDFKFEFIILEFSIDKEIIARKYSKLHDVSILPSEETSYLRAYIVPENNRFIYNVELNVIKENMRILNNTILDIDPDNIYNPDSRVNIMKNNDKLSVSVPELNKKFIYFSYGIQNNSFNKIPETSLVDL